MDARRNIPLEIRPILEKVLKGKMSDFEFEDVDTEGFQIVEKDNDDSKFYFTYVQSEEHLKRGSYLFQVQPSSDSLGHDLITINLADLEYHLKAWIQRVNRFKAYSPLFDDDPILSSYIKEQEGYFEIIDEDAEYAPFSFQRQKLLYNVYDQIIQEVLQEEEQTPKLQAYVKELKESQAEIGADTKKEAVSKFSRNIAKARKLGIGIFEKIIVKLSAEGAIALWPKVAGLAQALLT